MSTAAKIARDLETLVALLEPARARGETIVLTNGTFDLIHVGHVRVLEAARALGDRLVVGLNSDASVRRYKGEGRPVVPGAERAEILAAFHCVDHVVLFDERTAEALIRRVRPHVHAKGTDYREDTLPEAAVLKEVGARLVIVGDEKTHAATDLIRRIRELPSLRGGP